VVELQAGYLSSDSPTQNCNGKIHLAAAIGLALVENGRRVLFMRTGELVQRLQITRRELGLESAITKLDNITCSSSTTSHMSARTGPRPACCSS